jgi:hypothetical protein
MSRTPTPSRFLVGDRSERYLLDVDSTREIYVRPGIHPDPEPMSVFESIVHSSFAAIGRLRLDLALGILCVLAVVFVMVRPALVHH